VLDVNFDITFSLNAETAREAQKHGASLRHDLVGVCLCAVVIRRGKGIKLAATGGRKAARQSRQQSCRFKLAAFSRDGPPRLRTRLHAAAATAAGGVSNRCRADSIYAHHPPRAIAIISQLNCSSSTGTAAEISSSCF